MNRKWVIRTLYLVAVFILWRLYRRDWSTDAAFLLGWLGCTLLNVIDGSWRPAPKPEQAEPPLRPEAQ
jgi:hypothetical protein